MLPRIYVYKITFEETPEWYYGRHWENKYDEYYMGSPVTHREFWVKFSPLKEILKTFEPTLQGWLEAHEMEKSLIQPDLRNPLCLNENVGGFINPCLISERVKKKWEDPEYREKMCEKAKEMFKDEEFRSRFFSGRDEAIQALWRDKEFRERRSKEISDIAKERHRKDPSHMQKMRILAHTPEAEAKRLKTLTERGGQFGERAPTFGKIWITDGTREGNRMVDGTEPIPEGFYKGRVGTQGKGDKSPFKGKFWVTNGTPSGNLFLTQEQEIPEGYFRGRTI